MHSEAQASGQEAQRPRLLIKIRSLQSRQQQLLQQQQPWRQALQERAMLEQPWPCGCWHYRGKKLSCRRACPVHANPAQGVARCVELVQSIMPTATVYAEVPVWSIDRPSDKSSGLAVNGRALGTGQFTGHSQPDLSFDLMVKSSEGVFAAIEACGREHTGATARARDGKKAVYAARKCLRIAWLHMTHASSWQEQLLELKRACHM